MTDYGIDWTSGMQRSYSLVSVDADAWTEGAACSTAQDISIELDDEGTRLSVSLDAGEALEGYWRVYMDVVQGGVAAHVPLATFLVTERVPRTEGHRTVWGIEGHSCLWELDVQYPDIGWTCSQEPVTACAKVVASHCRAPLASYAVPSSSSATQWTAEEDETWLDVLEALLALAGMHVEVDAWGRVVFAADVADVAAAACAWTFGDAEGEASVLLPDASAEPGESDIPNAVHVVLSTDDGYLESTVTDDDASRATSTVRRGYAHVLRETSPDLDETATQAEVDAYAQDLLDSYTHATVPVTYTHAWVPGVAVGSVVGLDYPACGVTGRALVTAQGIECTPACLVEETAECEPD